MKVTELTKEQLNYLTAKAQGWKRSPTYNHDGEHIGYAWEGDGVYISPDRKFDPINNPEHFSKLIANNEVVLERAHEGLGGYYAGIIIDRSPSGEPLEVDMCYGDTAEIALCRALVVLEYGDEVPDDV